MNERQWLILLFLVGWLGASGLHIRAMLGRRRCGAPLHRDRMTFIFSASVLVVCLSTMVIKGSVDPLLLAADLCAVGANVFGFALTCCRRLGSVENDATMVRTYQLYYRGRYFALVTRKDFDLLQKYGLIKKQVRVELIEDYSARARQIGLRIEVLQDGSGRRKLAKVSGDRGAI